MPAAAHVAHRDDGQPALVALLEVQAVELGDEDKGDDHACMWKGRGIKERKSWLLIGKSSIKVTKSSSVNSTDEPAKPQAAEIQNLASLPQRPNTTPATRAPARVREGQANM